MIGFLACSKSYQANGQAIVVLDAATCLVGSSERVAILADPGSGKSTLIRMLCGLEQPTAGRVIAGQGLVWPLGACGPLSPGLTGEQNIRLMATNFNADPDAFSLYCHQFSELGQSYFTPLRDYSSGMRARLGFALSMAVPAATYVSEDMVSIGNARFRAKCDAALSQRLRSCGLILFTRNPRTAARLGDRHGVLRDGRLDLHASAEAARASFEAQDGGYATLQDLVRAFATA